MSRWFYFRFEPVSLKITLAWHNAGKFVFNYRPQRSWGKVMFLQVCVILFTGGEYLTRYTPPQTRYTPRDQDHNPRTRYTPQDQVHPPGPGTPPRPGNGPGTPPRTRYTPRTREPPRDQGDTVTRLHPTGMQSCFSSGFNTLKFTYPIMEFQYNF